MTYFHEETNRVTKDMKRHSNTPPNPQTERGYRPNLERINGLHSTIIISPAINNPSNKILYQPNSILSSHQLRANMITTHTHINTPISRHNDDTIVLHKASVVSKYNNHRITPRMPIIFEGDDTAPSIDYPSTVTSNPSNCNNTNDTVKRHIYA